MPVEIQKFHEALRCELSCLLSSLEDYVVYKKRADEDHTRHSGDSSSTDSGDEIVSLRSDFQSFITVLVSHSDSEDTLIFPVLNSRSEQVKIKMAIFDNEHEKINSAINSIKSQWAVYPVVSSESAKTCILEDIVAKGRILEGLLHQHLNNEDMIVHPLMSEYMSTDELNMIVGRVLGHRSSDVMEKILQLLYRHLSNTEFNLCLENIQKSVSGTFFQKWLAALPPRVHETIADSETAISSILEDAEGAEGDDIVMKNNSAVASVMSGAIPGELREVALEHLRKDYGSPVQYSLEEVIRLENARSAKKIKKRKRYIDLKELASSSKKRLEEQSTTAEADRLVLSVQDMEKSYFSEEEKVLGCTHYRRKCKIVAPCCSRVFVCRLCHNDNVPDGHEIDRYAIKTIVCMMCNTVQPRSDTCCNASCKTIFSKYFCKICNLYDGSNEPIYHCPYCNVCRKGTGLGIDSELFHCMTCNACVRNGPGMTHKCLSHSIERTCPICQTYLFDSVDKLKGLRCGHVMHLGCFTEYQKKSDVCPYCRTTMDEEVK